MQSFLEALFLRELSCFLILSPRPIFFLRSTSFKLNYFISVALFFFYCVSSPTESELPGGRYHIHFFFTTVTLIPGMVPVTQAYII